MKRYLFAAIFILFVIAGMMMASLSAHADTAADTQIRIRIALAIAAAEQAKPKADDGLSIDLSHKSLTYAEALAECLRTGKPMVVYVGYQAAEPIDGCIVCRHTGQVGIWIGVPKNGIIYRSIISPTSTEGEILAAIHKLDKSLNAPPVQAGWSNVGDCNCSRTTGRCQCIPASKCPAGCPVQPQAKPQQYQPQYAVPMTFQVPSYGGRVCRT